MREHIDEKCLITIVTPTYNRAEYLKKLYVSLKGQISKNFKWFIIDDGSKDDTRAVVQRFLEEVNRGFEIRYVYQKNGGKHTALNRGIKVIDTELTFIVDSDDYLPVNSIEIVLKYHNKYKPQREKLNLCGYSFLRCHADGSVNTAYFPENEKIDSYRNVRINGNIGGDKAEVFYTDILKKFSFPVFEGEKFLPEDIVWMQMSGPYNMVHINENIYICDYLQGGLTNSGRKMKIKSPRGMLLRSQIYLNDSEVCIKVKIKMMLLYIIYSGFAEISIRDAAEAVSMKWLFYMLLLPGKILQIKWKFDCK